MTVLITETVQRADDVPLRSVLERQRTAFNAGAPDYERRMQALRSLRDGLESRADALAAAISEDFGGRSPNETYMLELLPLFDQIRHAKSSLAGWMKARRVSPTWFLRPSRAYVIHQPLGVVGVIGAWNYPLLLTLGPLIDALAAGNHVMLKPSEATPLTAAAIAELMGTLYPPDYVTTVTGGPDVAAEFSALPFDHLMFTGSTSIGRLVMRAAGANLTPVTLELGGKSPAIVHESYPLERALRRILSGKLFNAGQTCVAPDYLLVPHGREAEIETLARSIVAELYPRLVDNADYTRILSRDHYQRLIAVLANATAHDARVVTINPANEPCSIANKVFPPTLVFGAPDHAELMRDEIFGPILPIVGYRSLNDAIAFVNARPRPLALYYFDNSRSRARSVVQRTTSGGVLVNDVVLHLGQHNLPFGGVGPSGMGQYHGFDGFQTFSKKKGVMIQSRWSFAGILAPPFTDRTRALIRRLIRLSAH